MAAPKVELKVVALAGWWVGGRDSKRAEQTEYVKVGKMVVLKVGRKVRERAAQRVF